jgi:hypothetical protein
MTHALSAAEYEPYGHVRYADVGYRADRKKRYPLSDEAHCRNAWSRINDPANAKFYTPAQLARIKSRIKSAGRRYGITFAEDKVAAAANLLGVELARPGRWDISTGPFTVTAAMLHDAARFANREGARPAPLKFGHKDKRFAAGDGEPALGWVHNVRVEDDDQGPVLMGDLMDMPDWLADAMPRHWPDRSIEGWEDYELDGEKYGLVVEALALLGVAPPGMSSIKSLRDLPAALGVAASGALEPSGRRVVASFGERTTSALEAGEPIKKGAGMSLAKYREALAGLPDDASEDDVEAALKTAGFAPQITPPPEAPEAVPVAASAKPAPGTIVLASSVWEENQNTIKRLQLFVDRADRNERDSVIAEAVQVGKFTPAQKPHFTKLWDADPKGTRALIDSLMKNTALAVAASGYAGEGEQEDDELDREIARLSAPTRTGG